ncbi:MAG: hypothetical protein Q9187_003963 [Circinaria calcarea]
MSSEDQLKIKQLEERLEESQTRLREARDNNNQTFEEWRVVLSTTRERIQAVNEQNKDLRAIAKGLKHELEAWEVRSRQEAEDRERELVQIEMDLREAIEQELRETMEQDLTEIMEGALRKAIEDEHKANYVCHQRKGKAREGGKGVRKRKKAPVQTLASTRKKRTFPSKYKR